MRKSLRFMAFILALILIPVHSAFAEPFYITYMGVTGQKPAEQYTTENNEYFQAYTDVDQDAFNQYISAVNAFTLVPFLYDDSDGRLMYVICSITDGKGAIIAYTPEEKLLLMRGDAGVPGIDDYELVQSNLQQIWGVSLKMPAETKGYVLPQFYAISETPKDEYHGYQIEGMSLYFNDARCWVETYSDIPWETIDQYLFIMYLFGCDFVGKYLYVNDDNEYRYFVDLTQDGQTLITLSYNPQSLSAEVAYNPKVSFDLKGGAELLEMLP